MSTNQRKNERREKQRRNDARTRKIIWGILIAVIIILIVMKVCEIDFESIKERFTDSNGNFSISFMADKNAYPLTLDSAKDVSVNVINDKLCVLTDNSLSVYSPKNADKSYSYTHGYANPVIRYSGSYVCLFDQGSNRIRLDTVKDSVYEKTTDQPILTADVSKKGYVIFATRSDDAKSTVFVYDKSLNKKTEFDVNSGYVTAVAIDPSGKYIAYAVVNSKNAALTLTVYTRTVGEDKETSSFSYNDTDILSLKYASTSKLYFVGSDTAAVISSQKDKTDIHKKGSVYVNNYCYTDDNELVIVTSDYSRSSSNTAEYVRASGEVKTKISLEGAVKSACAQSNELCVLYSDGVIVYSLSTGEKKNEYSCSDSVNSVCVISNDVFVNKQKTIDLMSE